MNEPFFPPQQFSKDEDYNHFIVEWYTKHLTSMAEPILWTLAADSSSHLYRFLWLRTFDPPISVRLEVYPDNTGQITGKSQTAWAATNRVN